MAEQHKRLGEQLLERGLITPDQLRIALEVQRATGRLLGETLVDLGFISSATLSSLVSEGAGVASLPSLEDLLPDSQALRLVPRELAAKHRLVPLSVEDDHLVVAMADPYDVVAVDELRRVTGRPLRTLVAPEEEILKALDRWYESEGELEELVRRALAGEAREEEAPVVGIVNQLLALAVQERATDVHIEPQRNAMVVRYRVDGVLQVRHSLPKALEPRVVSRIKVMANMDISETRRPQDGRAEFRFGGRTLDLRVSCFPVTAGENVVIRILDRARLLTRLDALGYAPEQLEALRRLIRRREGILLVTGPTGSGKTTTLYAALSEVNTTAVNIMTLEDPVEYELPFVRQSQVNPRAGLGFAQGLRSILRQDPDVIMVGEIRDAETLEVAMHAALTGHLVLSTLHTNSALGAIPRLLHLGASPHLLASTLIGVVAQRLVRRVCPHCRAEYAPAEPEANLLEERLGARPERLWRGAGCARCRDTGYLGRTVVAEVLQVDPQVAALVEARAGLEELERAVRERGFRSMLEDALQKAAAGITTLEEVQRVVSPHGYG